jgi:hypothetical protein
MQWIANLIRRLRKPATTEESLPCVHSLAEGNVRIDVLEYQLPCGHCAYIIRGEYFVEETDTWVKIADLRDFNAEATVWLLQRAARFVAALEHGLVADGEVRGPRELPTVKMFGRRFFLDERLKELRNVENPHDRIQLVPESL